MKHWETINFLRAYRSKGLKAKDMNENIESLLKELAFVSQTSGALNAEEVKYLTGEWFEQYIYNKVKIDLGLDDLKILIGVKLNKDVKDNEDMLHLAHKINENIKEPIVISDKVLFMTLSIGISIFPDDALDWQGLVNIADAKMFEHKKRNK